MSLKIVGGSAKGRLLKAPKSPLIRPARASVRQAIFNILPSVEGNFVLDLYAGSGSVGMEALSRGAKAATFVDSGFQAIALLKENLKRLNFSHLAYLLKKEVCTAIRMCHKMKKTYDLIFIDPPYDKGLVNKTLACLQRHPIFHPMTQIIIERSPREKINLTESFKLVDERQYGQTIISFLGV
ncbi:MAG: 16S rRNA (guanine(966)-N(2))-methyltransferase RsmD [Deltaproteobacteria bacterium]|nr:16S rRNA (guanine(966)-N(2))-methyltransferase RsmD [Deltaproteobacteria bacterium]